MVIFLAMVFLGESVAGVDVYTVGLSSRMIEDMEGCYDVFNACAHVAASKWTSDHENSPILRMEVDDDEDEGEVDKTRPRDRYEDFGNTRVATLGVGDDGNWPVLQFEKDGRFWSLKPSVLPSLVKSLKNVAMHYGWKRVGVVEDKMEASNAGRPLFFMFTRTPDSSPQSLPNHVICTVCDDAVA
jgi:hypothetical protein